MVDVGVCPQCGLDVNGHDTFCGACGARVTAPPGGTQAGVQLTEGDDLLLDKLRELTVGEYEVRGLLGRGGMASVFVAYDLTLNRRVALKAMHPGLLGDSGMRERFRLEARLSARLDHPNIVTVHAVKERGTIVFFDLKLIDGVSLDKLVRYRNAPLPTKVARWATAKIADALHYAHGEAVVHRDVKPANVMVDRRGDLIVTDFGIAKAAESPHLTMTGAVVGTPAYMSPEQCLGNEITPASDQYSLGVLAYELLTGAVPFSGSMLTIQLGHVEKTPQPPHAVIADIPQPASDVVMRMMAKDPADRWPTLAEAADALIEGLGATDAQMRRELAALVQTLPDELGRRSLPPTPRSPTPATFPTAAATRAVEVPPRVQDVATEMMPLTPARPTPVLAPETVEKVAGRKRVLPFAAVAIAVVAVVAAIGLSGGRSSEQPAAAPAPAPDSTPIVAIGDTLDARLEASDTTVLRIGLDPIMTTLRVGDSTLLKATAYGATGDAIQRRMQWTSDDTARVTVSSSGWARAHAPTVGGPVPITATADKRSGVALITVVK